MHEGGGDVAGRTDARLETGDGIGPLLADVLDLAISLTGAQMGLVQALDPATGRLRIVAQQGFERPFLDYFALVGPGDAACGAALAARECVTVPDVALSAIFLRDPEMLRVMLGAGARAVQSTPILGQAGDLLGVLSTHSHTPRQPSDQQLRLLGLLARQTAVAMENMRFVEALRESEAQARERAVELQAVLDAVPAAVLIARDGDARHMVGNRFCNEMLRVPTGANISASAPPDERPTAYRIFKDGVELPPHELPVQMAAATGAEIRDYEFDLVHEDQTRTLLGNASPLAGPDGRPAGAVGAFLDVTAWKQAESQVRLFARVVETTSDFIGICTPDMKPIFLNEAGRRMVGLESMEDVRRTVLMDYFWPEDRARIESEAIPTLVREGRWSGEIRFRHFKTGEPIPTMWNAFVIRDDAGAPTAWATVSPDLTALKNAEEELREANSQLTEADRRKSEFLAVLSHELRNPLAPIRNSIYMLDRAPAGSPQAARAREVIRRQTEHLTRLVDDLLDMTRIARGKIELHREILDLREIVRRTHDDHQSLFDRRDVEVRLEGRPSPVWVDGDPTRLAQVVGNLLQNAAKFAQEGGSTRITVAEANNRAEVRVRDDGVGIEPDQLRRVFEPFAQADSGSGRRLGGLGLGLALAKGLVELHGGTLTARSEGLGRGSEFTVSLPLATLPLPAGTVERPTRAAGPRSIIIIEDNADAASTLADALALGGHSIHVALDGRSGIELARSVNPDIVICDIGLPDVDGYEVARTLRADQELRSTRLVALSGYAQPQDKERAKEAGFDSHLSKPSSLDELNEVVASSSRRP